MDDCVSIRKDTLLDLIHWARRYCDGLVTYDPSLFNRCYRKIIKEYPEISSLDQFDRTLKDEGSYWPYCKDGWYEWEKSQYDAMPEKGAE